MNTVRHRSHSIRIGLALGYFETVFSSLDPPTTHRLLQTRLLSSLSTQASTIYFKVAGNSATGVLTPASL